MEFHTQVSQIPCVHGASKVVIKMVKQGICCAKEALENFVE